MQKEDLLAKLETLLPKESIETLDLACCLTIQSICNYCNLDEAPDGLLYPAALMARGLVVSAQLAAGAARPAVRSVSRGDTSYSFATVTEQMAQIAAGNDFLTDYRAQLNAYRRMR